MELTRILDTLKDADGNLASGQMSLENRAFIAADQTAVAGGQVMRTITAGVVDLLLAPTEGASPTITYEVFYALANRAVYSEKWNVPRAGGPYKINQVRT